MPAGSAIYVETRVRGDLEDLWRLTQTPEEHERWDLRFTDIEYLPKADEAEPQRFRYATRIGFGMRIEGAGETVGSRDGPGSRTSALKFWSDDPKSLIRIGSGYWKYEQTDDGVRFLTGYDYQTRFGALGRWFDRLLFRPLMGWATAWSFDRLRLWIERGLDPADAMDRSLTNAVARISLALIWIYQGLIPKMLFVDTSGEIETVTAAGVPSEWARAALLIAGAIEALFGLALLVLWRMRALYLFNIAALVALAATATVARPEVFIWQFNPAALNLAMIALAAVGWVSARRELPSSRRCRRRPPEDRP